MFAALIGLSGGMITVIFFAVWRRAFGWRTWAAFRAPRRC